MNQSPHLLIRAVAGDTGARPITGVFWESPDIFIVAGVAPGDAPAVPIELGGVARANADNTVYARVWNFGDAPAVGVLVEFYWFPPTLRFDAGVATLIGSTFVDLGPLGAQQIVKCPTAWHAEFLNGGHECLVVRVSDAIADPLGSPAFDAARNRHVGQRNIHVMTALEAATKPTIGIVVGGVGERPVQVTVARAAPATVPLLGILGVTQDKPNRDAQATINVGITPPLAVGEYVPSVEQIAALRARGVIAPTQIVARDGQQIALTTNGDIPPAGEAAAYRVIGSQDGEAFGGYTVIVLGPQADPHLPYAIADLTRER